MLKELASVPAGIQALEAVGTVTTQDYDRVFAPLVDRVRRTKGRMRLLYQFGPGFERITPGALWADTRLGVGYLAALDGCAVVSDIEWIRAPARGIGAWMPCPLRVYGNAERDDAVAWLAALPRGAEVSSGAWPRPSSVAPSLRWEALRDWSFPRAPTVTGVVDRGTSGSRSVRPGPLQ